MVVLLVALVDIDVVVLAIVDMEVVVAVTATNRVCSSSQIANGCGFEGSRSNRSMPRSQQPSVFEQQNDVSLPVTLAQDIK